MQPDFDSIYIKLVRCEQSDLEPGQQCLSDAEMDAYWSQHYLSFYGLDTQIDYEDIDSPMKTEFKLIFNALIDLKN